MPTLRVRPVPGTLAGLLGLALLAATPAIVVAQDISSPYRFVEEGQEANVFGGSFGADRGRFGFAPGDGALLGLRYALHVSDALAVEGLGSYIDATRNVIDPDRAEGDRVIGEAPADLFFVDLRLRFSLTGRRTWHGIMPYLFTGGSVGFGMSGLYEIDGEIEAPDRFEFGTELGASMGGGARIRVTDRWAVRADGALLLYRVDVPEGYQSEDRPFTGVPDAEWTNNLGLTLGLSYLF